MPEGFYWLRFNSNWKQLSFHRIIQFVVALMYAKSLWTQNAIVCALENRSCRTNWISIQIRSGTLIKHYSQIPSFNWNHWTNRVASVNMSLSLSVCGIFNFELSILIWNIIFVPDFSCEFSLLIFFIYLCWNLKYVHRKSSNFF